MTDGSVFVLKADKTGNLISFWRVVFTYTIIFVHFFNQYKHFTGWYIGVEFFFMVSGWLLAADTEKRNRNAFDYTLSRIKRLYPEYFWSFIVSATFLAVYYKLYTGASFLQWLFNVGIREMLMIHYWPWGDASVLANVATWYLSVLVLAGLILYSLAKRSPALLKEIIIPISVVVFFSYSYRNFHSLAKDDIAGVFWHVRFFRGFSEMGLGILLYELNARVGRYLRKPFFYIVGFILLAVVVACSLFICGDADYLYALMIAAAVPLAFNTPVVFGTKIIHFFEKISYSVFLNHIVIRTYVFPYFFKEISIIHCVLYLICVTLFSIFMYYFSKWINTKIKILFTRIIAIS